MFIPATFSQVATQSSDPTKPPRHPLLILFFIFQIIGGNVGFPILLIFVFGLRNPAAKHPLFVNFCIIWILSSVTFCLLLYTGYDTGPEPPYALCLIQSSLSYGSPVIASTALWALIFHLWFCIRGTMSKDQLRSTKNRLYILVALPYVVGFPFVLAALLLGLQRPEIIRRSHTSFGFHCSAKEHAIRTAVSVAIALILVCILVWEGLVGMILYKNALAVRQTRVFGWRSINLFARLSLFTLYILVGLAACAVAIAFPSNRFRILFQASLPTAAFFFFGSRTRLFSRQNQERSSTSEGRSNQGSQPGRAALALAAAAADRASTNYSDNSLRREHKDLPLIPEQDRPRAHGSNHVNHHVNHHNSDRRRASFTMANINGLFGNNLRRSTSTPLLGPPMTQASNESSIISLETATTGSFNPSPLVYNPYVWPNATTKGLHGLSPTSDLAKGSPITPQTSRTPVTPFPHQPHSPTRNMSFVRTMRPPKTPPGLPTSPSEWEELEMGEETPQQHNDVLTMVKGRSQGSESRYSTTGSTLSPMAVAASIESPSSGNGTRSGPLLFPQPPVPRVGQHSAVNEGDRTPLRDNSMYRSVSSGQRF